MVFAPSNELMALLLYGDPHQVFLYDTTGGTLVNQWPGQQMGFLPGDQLWVENEGAVRVFDITNDTATAPISGSQAVFSTDGNSLAVFSAGMVSLFDVQNGRSAQTLEGSYDEVDRLTFFPDDASLAGLTSVATCPGCIEYQSALTFWRVSDGIRLFEIEDAERPILLGFPPDGASIAVTQPDGVRFFRTGDGTLIHSFTDFSFSISGVAFSPDGEMLALGKGLPAYNVSLWSIADGRVIKLLEKPEAYGTSSSLDIAFSPDGKFLAMGDAFWQVANGERLIEMELEMVDRFHLTASSLALAPGGQTLAVGFGQNGLSLWNLPEGKFIRELRSFEGWVTGLSFSPDGTTLASVYAFPDYAIQLWGLPEGDRLYTIEGENFWKVVYSPDGNILATISVQEEGEELPATPAGSVQLWQATVGESIRKFDVSDGSALAFSPDGEVLASGSDDGTVILWGIP